MLGKGLQPVKAVVSTVVREEELNPTRTLNGEFKLMALLTKKGKVSLIRGVYNELKDAHRFLEFDKRRLTECEVEMKGLGLHVRLLAVDSDKVAGLFGQLADEMMESTSMRAVETYTTTELEVLPRHNAALSMELVLELAAGSRCEHMGRELVKGMFTIAVLLSPNVKSYWNRLNDLLTHVHLEEEYIEGYRLLVGEVGYSLPVHEATVD